MEAIDFLSQFIGRHDGCRLVNHDRITGTIYVEATDGTGKPVIDEIPATLKAVRDWLGY